MKDVKYRIKAKHIFIFSLVLLLCSSFVSAGFWDWITGLVAGECTYDSDCTSVANKYCDGSKACVSSMVYTCINGECISSGASGGCQICEYGCENGDCKGKPTPPCGQYGDLNNDGYVTKEDVTEISNCVLGKISADFCKARGDVNGDGNVNVLDITVLNRYIGGLDSTFPVCIITTTTTTIPPKCTDSDGGINYYEVGITNGKSDSCLVQGGTHVTITEYYCNKNGEVQSELYQCPYGCAADETGAGVMGKCNGDGTILKCSDSDNGLNYYEKGKVTAGKFYKNDFCGIYDFNQNQLFEWTCENNEFKFKAYTCPNGCKDGACIKEVTSCEDYECPDGTIAQCWIDETGMCICEVCEEPVDKCIDLDGKNYYLKSRAYNPGTGMWLEDYCSSENKLWEAICNEVLNIAYFNGYDCPNGCEDGACVKGCFSNNDCSADQFCEFSGCFAETGTCVDVPQFCPDVYSPVCGCDGKTYSNDCARQEVKVSKKHDGECKEECSGEGEIMGIYGCCAGLIGVPNSAPSPTSPNVCVHMDHYICLNCGDGVCSKGENWCNCDDCEETVKCTDSDNGLNYYVKGKTCVEAYCKTDACIHLDDCDESGECVSYDKLIEYYCVKGDIQSMTVDCKSGCVDGACLIPLPDECDGCLMGDRCVFYGTRLIIENKPVYCDITGEFAEQKGENEECQNNYECNSNVCVNNKCISQNLMQRIMEWFVRLFGG